jgi:riboflavin biosynthesis pyrimidine reductase
VIDSFIRQELFDEMLFFYSGRLVGGRDSAQPFASGTESLGQAPELADCHWSHFADGSILRGYRRCSPA